MAKVTVNAAKAIRELGKMGHRLRHPEGGLKRVGQYVKGLSQQAFRDGADPTTHRPWKNLSPATLKQRRGTTAQILVDTSRLRKSIHSIMTGKKTVAIGTDVKYGKYHQFGTKHMSKRPFLGIDRAGETEIKGIIKRYIVEGRA